MKISISYLYEILTYLGLFLTILHKNVEYFLKDLIFSINLNQFHNGLSIFCLVNFFQYLNIFL